MRTTSGAVLGVRGDGAIIFVRGPKVQVTADEARELAVALWMYAEMQSLPVQVDFATLYRELMDKWA